MKEMKQEKAEKIQLEKDDSFESCRPRRITSKR